MRQAERNARTQKNIKRSFIQLIETKVYKHYRI